MNSLLILFAIAGLAHVVGQKDGPWGIIAWSRNMLVRMGGPIIFQMFECSFCLGFWTSLASYLLLNGYVTWNISTMLTWGFAGAMFNFLLTKLTSSE